MALAAGGLILITAAAKLMMRVCINCNNKKCIDGSNIREVKDDVYKKEQRVISNTFLSAFSHLYKLCIPNIQLCCEHEFFSILSVLIFKIREKESILKHHA